MRASDDEEEEDVVIVDVPVHVEELVIERRAIDPEASEHTFEPRVIRVAMHEQRVSLEPRGGRMDDERETADDHDVVDGSVEDGATDEHAQDGAFAAQEEFDESVKDDARSR